MSMRVREWHTQPTDSMNSEQIAIAFRSREYPLKNILNCKLKWDLDGEYFVMRHRHEGCSLSTRHTQHNELTTANSANAYRIVINNPCVCARAFFCCCCCQLRSPGDAAVRGGSVIVRVSHRCYYSHRYGASQPKFCHLLSSHKGPG